ncbi:hypothetical protein ACFM35_10655 [Microbacterium sp. P01]|uniref:hypothetical protein n=1 Tax=Microbacterium sp. P01 TaxID=3366261 RepID=UPI00366F5827
MLNPPAERRTGDIGRVDAHTSHDDADRAPQGVTSDAHTPEVATGERKDALLRDVHAREKAKFGGIKFGTAFFGWLTATGAAVILATIVAAVGAAVGVSAGDSAGDAAADNAGTIAVVSAIVLGLVLLVAYFAGGYVAGRMARFSGAKQGLAVWIWAVAIAIVVAAVTAIAGSQWDVLANLDSFPRIPVTPETATVTGVLTALGALAVALIGAVLGGLAGMRYHRKVDRAGLAE